MELYTLTPFFYNRYEEIEANNTLGVFEDLITLIDIVQNNHIDIADGGTNVYMLVGKVNTGLYPLIEEVAWYEWNKEFGEYQQIPNKPKCIGENFYCTL